MIDQIKDNLLRDFILLVALGTILEENGEGIEKLMTKGEQDAIERFVASVPDADDDYSERNVALTKRMHREVLERLLPEVTQPAAETGN